jgi:4-alpha-glucanotransferase
MASVADLVVIPVQDILGLDEDARMNRPAASKGNWQWRLARGQLTRQISDTLAGLTKIYGRI